MDDAFAVSRMPEIGLSGSMWRGPETARWQTYSGTKPETADTDKASLQRHRAGPRPDQEVDPVPLFAPGRRRKRMAALRS
jgi:hypothetical protein